MTGITLTGPNPAQPFDLQTQQAQLAMAQQLAQQMLAQGIMGQSPAVIHTGGNNPFARDVPNIAGPIAKVVDAYLGSQNLSNIQDRQMQLAQQYNAMTQADEAKVNNAYFGTPATPGGPAGDAGELAAPVQGGAVLGAQEAPQTPLIGGTPAVAGSPAAAIAAAGQSLNPQIRAQGDALRLQQAKMLADAWVAQQETPTNIAELGRQFTPQSIAANSHTSSLGYPVLNNGAVGLQKLSTAEVTNPGQSVNLINPNPAAAGAVGGGAGAGAPSSTQVVAGGQPKYVPPAEPGGPAFVIDANGNMTPVPISAMPGASATQDVAKGQFDQAAADKDKLLSFQAATPGYVIMAKLAQSAYDQGTMGFAAPQINMVRQFLAATGSDPDVANRITNFQTFLKFAVPAATANLKEGVGPRPSQLEFNSFLGALGATGETDPRAVMNMIQQRLIDGTNQGIIHNNNLKSLGPQTDPVSGAITSPGLPGYSSVAPALQVNFDPASQILTPLSQAGVVASWDQNPTSGLFTNHLIANPATQKPAVPVGGKQSGGRSIHYNDLPPVGTANP